VRLKHSYEFCLRISRNRPFILGAPLLVQNDERLLQAVMKKKEGIVEE
jgi:hypothetical protein